MRRHSARARRGRGGRTNDARSRALADRRVRRQRRRNPRRRLVYRKAEKVKHDHEEVLRWLAALLFVALIGAAFFWELRG